MPVFSAQVYMKQEALKIRPSLPLQICLYFNLYLLPLWCWIELNQNTIKEDTIFEIDQESQLYNFLWTVSFLLMSSLEVVRLYVGYVGNQLEKAQHMLAFVFLSSCLQLPNHLFRLTALQSWNWHLPHKIAWSVIAFALLCLEMSFGCWHLRTIFKRIYFVDYSSDKCQTGSDRMHQQIKSAI